MSPRADGSKDVGGGQGEAGKAQGSYVFPSGIPFEATVTKGKKKSTLTLEMAGNVHELK